MDDIEDSGFGGKLKAYLVLPLVAGANKKAAKKYPELKKILDETIATQSQVEKEENPCLDACAGPTAQWLAANVCYVLRRRMKGINTRITKLWLFSGKMGIYR